MGLAIDGNIVHGIAKGGQAFKPIVLTYIGLPCALKGDGAIKYDENGKSTGIKGTANYWAKSTIIDEKVIAGQKFVEAKADTGTTAFFKAEDISANPIDATSKIVNVLNLDLNSAQSGNAWVLRTNSSIDSSWNGKKVMLIYSYNLQIDNNASNMLTISEIFRFDGMSPQTVSSVSNDGKIDLFNFAGQFFQISCRTQTNTSDKSEAHGFLLQFAE